MLFMLVIKLYEECVKGSIKNLKSAVCFRTKGGREREREKKDATEPNGVGNTLDVTC